jgi:hypothetical protein
MPRKPRERDEETNAAARTKNGQATDRITKDNADATTESGNPAGPAVQELTRAYQELMTKNVRKLTDSMQALAKVKSPAEFMELQQQLMREGVEAAVSDSQQIAQLTNAVLIAAFQRVKTRFESAREGAQT